MRTWNVTCDLSKLHDELLQAGIKPLSVQGMVNPTDKTGQRCLDVRLDLPDDTDMTLVESVIAAHDPTPRPVPPTMEDRLKAAETTIVELKKLLGIL